MKGVIAGGTTTVFAGQHKTGKTALLMQLAMAVAAGTHWLWWETTEMPVLYLNYEVAEWSFQKRAKRQLAGFADSVHGDENAVATLRRNLHVASLPDLRLDRSEDWAILAEEVDRFSAGLVIIDPIRGSFRGDSNLDEAVNEVMQGLLENVVQATGAAIILAHHMRKPSPGAREDGSSLNVKGSGAWADAADGVMTIRSDRRHGTSRYLNLTLRHFESQQDLEVRFLPHLLRFAPVGEVGPDTDRRLSEAFAAADGEMDVDGIARVLGVHRTTTLRRIADGRYPQIEQAGTAEKNRKLYTWRDR